MSCTPRPGLYENLVNHVRARRKIPLDQCVSYVRQCCVDPILHSIEHFSPRSRLKICITRDEANLARTMLGRYGRSQHRTLRDYRQEELCRMTNAVRQRLRDYTDATGLLAFTCAMWEHVQLCIRFTSFLFQEFDTNQIGATTLGRWLNTLHDIMLPDIQDRLPCVIVASYLKARRKEECNVRLLQRVASMYVLLGNHEHLQTAQSVAHAMSITQTLTTATTGAYTRYVETPILEDTMSYYRTQFAQMIAVCKGAEYMCNVRDVLQHERALAHAYLPISVDNILDAVWTTLVHTGADTIFSPSFSPITSFVREKKTEVLAMYTQLCAKYGTPSDRAEVTGLFAERLYQAHLTTGMEIIEERKQRIAHNARADKPRKSGTGIHDPEFVEALIAWRVFGTSYIQPSDPVLATNAFSRAAAQVFRCEDIGGSVSIASVLATYTDKLLRSGNCTEVGHQQRIRELVQIFTHIADKDMFLDMLWASQIGRILRDRWDSDTELYLIRQIQLEVGQYVTLAKMKSAVQNVCASQQVASAQYAPLLRAAKITQSELIVRMLGYNVAPALCMCTCALPRELEVLQRHYAQWYARQHPQRKLTWNLTNGTVTLGASLKTTHQLIVTVLQAVVLMSFNTTTRMTLRELAEVLHIQKVPDDVAKEFLFRSVHPLLFIKGMAVLKKEGTSKRLTMDTVVMLNESFTHKRRRLDIAARSPPLLERAQRGNAALTKHREFQVQAAIVRTAKTRGTVTHVAVVEEVVRQVRMFRPAPRMIKRCIGALIDREYLRRDAEEMSTYHYIA